LSHSEGFPEDNPWGDQQLKVTRLEMQRMISSGIPFSNAPGVAYEYSNFGFAILGEIVSRASGKPYNAYLAENILGPLGMTATTMDPTNVPADRLAHGYRWEDDRWKEEPLLRDGAFGPMGGMLTSIRDLARAVSAHLAAWPPRDGVDGVPIRRASLREMQQIADSAGRPRLETTPVSCNSMPLAMAMDSGLRKTAPSGTWSPTVEDCPGLDRRCDGCPSMASG
jgi:CubicO group peptidase (beta-lactamase class C family)